jgi:hypothetical protein
LRLVRRLAGLDLGASDITASLHSGGSSIVSQPLTPGIGPLSVMRKCTLSHMEEQIRRPSIDKSKRKLAQLQRDTQEAKMPQ